VVWVEALTAELGTEAAPEVIEAADAGATAEQGAESGGVAVETFGGEGVLSLFETLFKEGSPLGGLRPCGRIGLGCDEIAATYEDLGAAFVPVNVFDGDREERGAIDPGGEMAESSLEPGWAFAGIGEAALGRDPEYRVGVLEDGARVVKERDRTAGCAGFDGEEPEVFEERIAFEGEAIDGSEGVAMRVEGSDEEQADERIPPGGVIGEDDEWLLIGGGGRRAGDGEADGVKVTAKVTACIGREKGYRPWTWLGWSSLLDDPGCRA
jgi:hypothetical protein